MCQQNAAVAALIGRKDLHHVWSLVALLAVPALTNETTVYKDQDSPWAQTPFGRKLLHAMYYFFLHLFILASELFNYFFFLG